MSSIPRGVEKQLSDSWEGLRAGHGARFSFYDPESGVASSLEAAFEGLPGFRPDSIVRYDPLEHPLQPFSPLSEAIGSVFRRERDPDRILDSLGIYPRHRPLWKALLGGTPEHSVEPLISYEIEQEKLFLKRDALALLSWAAKRRPLAVACAHAECVPVETLALLSGPALADIPILLIFCYSARPRGEEADESWAQFYRDELANGSLLVLSEVAEERQEEARRARIGPEDFPRFLSFLHHDTVRRWALPLIEANGRDPGRLDPEEEFSVLQGLAVSFLGLGDPESGLFYAQTLWSESLSRGIAKEERTFMRCLLATLFRENDDEETALKTAIAAWKELGSEASERERAMLEFTLFDLNPHDGSHPEVFSGLEERLIGRMERFGWKNHLAFILCQNEALLDHYSGGDSDELIERVNRGIRLAEELGNLRTQAVGYKGIGMLEEFQGRLSLAERADLKSSERIQPIAGDLELARNDNGLGYFYFLQGNYQESFERHKRALERLSRGRNYAELLATLYNLGRIYLFNGQPNEAISLFESLLRIMEKLRIKEIPFNPKRNIYSLTGICCLDLGRIAQALEFDRRLRGMEAPDERDYSFDYQLWFACRKAEVCATPEEAESLFMRTATRMEERLKDSRHVLLRLLLDHARWQAGAGRADAARACTKRALALCLGRGIHTVERSLLRALLTGKRAKAPSPLPAVGFDPGRVFRLAEQDYTLKRLQSKIRELAFLQAWQDALRQSGGRDELFSRAVALLSQHFLADEAAIFTVPGESPLGGEPVLAAARTASASALAEAVKQRFREWGARPRFWEGPDGQRCSYLPIAQGERVRTLLWVSSSQNGLSEEDHRVLAYAAWQLGAALELLALHERLVEAATVDPLTGLMNRAEFVRRLDYHFRLVRRVGSAPTERSCLLFVDLYRFKRYNDDFGHGAGDLVIQGFTKTLVSSIRTSDLICRYGGDEFLALLPATDLAGAKVTADRLLADVRAREGFERELRDAYGQSLRVPPDERLTCSIGIAAAGLEEDIDSLIKRASDAAYRATMAGGNRSSE